MSKTISKVLSYAFHPTLMPVIGVYLLLNITHMAFLPYDGKIAIIKIVGLSTLVLPLMMLPALYYQRFITNITVSERNERLLPIALAIVFYFFGYYILRRLGAPSVIQRFVLASFICVFLAGVINLRWKISLHMIGLGGLIGLISAISYMFHTAIEIFLMGSILMAGSIGTARLYLKEHTQAQVYAGFLLGFIITFAIVARVTIMQ